MVSITNADLELYITENSVTTVVWKDNCRIIAFGDVVRITDRDGIRYEYVYTDVIDPVEASAEDLADTLNTYLITIPGGGGGGSGTVTSVALAVPAPTNPAFTVSGSPVTTSGTLTIAAAGTTGQYVRGDGSLANFPTSIGVGSFGVNAGNGQSVILPGQVGYWTAACNGTITDWAIQASNANGSIQFDIWKAAGALPTVANSIIGGGTKPFLTAQRYQKQAATFTTLAFSAGDVFGFYIDSNSTLVWAALQIFYTKT